MMARTCDACGDLIHGEGEKSLYLELSMRVLRTTESEDLGEQEQAFGDYCPACIADGKALADLLSGITKMPNPLSKDDGRTENSPAVGDVRPPD